MIRSVCLLLLLSVSAIKNSYSQHNDSDLIKHVIEKEVDALNRHYNLKEYLSCFARSEKVQVGPSNNKMTITEGVINSEPNKLCGNNLSRSFSGKAISCGNNALQ